ncbi:auxin efflux carrier superfamily protein [Polychaeton citri CBS 116435]|uniref:Auxin efflux carrier superfamily protein n=1 Tax=Polychaeton citri CBS 116435 TaxID=1314669 RepID=A0A9P4US43_9PEZI|nr:auxin efflux carrier superfamily protein [Polychaeton citri CBS 116435]
MAVTAANSTAQFFIEKAGKGGAHGSHPDLLHLAGLVCEAVLEVVFVALPGFLVAYTGMFDVSSQKFVAELNTMVFTPCLIFTKLASQLNADKLADLVVIPIIFVAQTVISWLCSQLVARLFGFGRKRRQKNFILAMGVFGNSNSLPISLVLSLSQTIAGLHWDKVPGDNDNEVAARGILYLLIFQQLGQLLRWTWGFNVLLKPAKAYEEDEARDVAQRTGIVEEGRYRDQHTSNGHPTGPVGSSTVDSGFSSASSDISRSASSTSVSSDGTTHEQEPLIGATPANGNIIDNEPRNIVKQRAATEPIHPERHQSTGHITQFPHFSRRSTALPDHSASSQPKWKRPFIQLKQKADPYIQSASDQIKTTSHKAFDALPTPIQKAFATIHYYHIKFWRGVWHQMNPPLWAMLAALIVASIPQLQHLFFTKGTLINNSFTRAVQTSGNVAVPLILVVLGANLARSTLPKDQIASTDAEKKEERKLLYASLLSRMVLPVVIMAPILAVMAKYVPVSILDDPIFVIVCFLLTGAPSALQLAQICQINEVFMGAMSNLLVASYVVAIFPSTLMLVLLALEVVEWAK